MGTSSELGAIGEDLASDFLQKCGIDLLVRNWRSKYGEIDFIGRDGDTVVFVEVKTRSGTGFGSPAEAVTFAKQRRIRKLAMAWLTEQNGPWVRIRFDVVGIIMARNDEPQITHLRAVF